MRRLFSTFPSGSPGAGLLLQRIVTAALLIRFGLLNLASTSFSAFPHIIGSCAAILFLVGLWTPLVGTLIAIVELWIAWTHIGDSSVAVVLASLGATVAMIGPGAWSIDALLFGRKHIDM